LQVKLPAYKQFLLPIAPRHLREFVLARAGVEAEQEFVIGGRHPAQPEDPAFG
jgi:hypothetical protein